LPPEAKNDLAYKQQNRSMRSGIQLSNKNEQAVLSTIHGNIKMIDSAKGNNSGGRSPFEKSTNNKKEKKIVFKIKKN